MNARDTDSAADLSDEVPPPSPRFDAWTRRFTDLLGITHDASSSEESTT